MGRLRVAVLISGRGSNLRALIDAAKDEGFPASIELVLSNNPVATGLVYAREANIPAVAIDHRAYPTRLDFEAELNRRLAEGAIEFICLAGFMRLLTSSFVEGWRDRMINIHPSLLPKYKGLDTHARVLDAGDKVTGCTIHFVRPDMDTGPIILRTEVPVRPGDSEETLADRVLEAEHHSYPTVLRAIGEGRVHVDRENVVIDGSI